MSSSVPYMSTSHIGLTLIVSFILYVCVGAVVNYRKLSQFKGPPLAGLSRLWLWKQSFAKRVHIAQAEALEKYGTTIPVLKS